MIPQWIMGLETEFGLMCASDSGDEPPLDVEAAVAKLFRPILAAGGSTNSFLFNGTWLYFDVGAHPEHATTECRLVVNLVANDRTGERLYASMAAQADSRLASKGVSGRIHLFKNNLDATGNLSGCHKNYLVRRRTDYRIRITTTLPHFVARQIVAGAGCIRRAKDDVAAYYFSQRADQVWNAISSAFMRSRPTINMRDEPCRDLELYRRMYVIVGNSSMCEATTALEAAVTQAVLAIPEDGGTLPCMELADPALAICETSVDLTGRVRLEPADGGWITPIEVQERTRETVLRHFDAKGHTVDLDASTSYLLDLQGRAVKSAKSEDTSTIATRIDWATKLSLFSRCMERADATLDDPRLARLDLAYHDTTAAGLRPSMEETDMLRTLAPPEAVQEAMTTPPSDTRAKLRGDFAEKTRRRRLDYVVDWTNLRLPEAEGTCSVVLKDPFALVDEGADRFMEEMDR